MTTDSPKPDRNTDTDGTHARVAIAVDPGCLRHDMGTGHAESPARLAALIALLKSDALALPSRVDLPWRLAEPEVLGLVHSASYVDTIKATEGRHVALDGDTTACPHSYEAALRAAGATLEAVDSVFDGRADRAFAFVRPPGHHAEPSKAMGFCLFNSAAVAAEHARKAHGISRVAIVDFDVHHGNGTQAAFWSDPDVLYISTHQFPWYPGSGAPHEIGALGAHGATVNIPLSAGHGDHQYDAIYGGLLSRVLEQFEPELILVSAGFDVMAADPLGGMNLTKDGIEAIARHLTASADRLCDGRLVMVLEGGYDITSLQDGVAACLGAMSERTPPHGALPQLKLTSLGDAGRWLSTYREWFDI